MHKSQSLFYLITAVRVSTVILSRYHFVTRAKKSYAECVGRWLEISTFCNTNIFFPSSSSVGRMYDQ